MANKYMHLLDDRPAVFDESYGMIFFAGRSARLCDLLVDDLRTIRKNEQTSIATRFRDFREKASVFTHGYLRIKVD